MKKQNFKKIIKIAYITNNVIWAIAVVVGGILTAYMLINGIITTTLINIVAVLILFIITSINNSFLKIYVKEV